MDQFKSGESKIGQDEQWKLLVLFIKKILAEKDITQEEFANQTGLTQSNVSRLFSLKYCPTLKTYLTLCCTLGINIHFMSRDDLTDFNIAFEKAMKELGRRG